MNEEWVNQEWDPWSLVSTRNGQVRTSRGTGLEGRRREVQISKYFFHSVLATLTRSGCRIFRGPMGERACVCWDRVMALGRFLPFHSTSVNPPMFHSWPSSPPLFPKIQHSVRCRSLRIFRSRPEAWPPKAAIKRPLSHFTFWAPLHNRTMHKRAWRTSVVHLYGMVRNVNRDNVVCFRSMVKLPGPPPKSPQGHRRAQLAGNKRGKYRPGRLRSLFPSIDILNFLNFRVFFYLRRVPRRGREGEGRENPDKLKKDICLRRPAQFQIGFSGGPRVCARVPARSPSCERVATAG